MTLVRRSKFDGARGSGHSPMFEVVSKLSLVDLAGSERVSAGVNGDNSLARIKESVNINTSLFVLRKVITALSRRSEGCGDVQHVPYRESKLTSLLQHSIGGSGFMLMLACLSPSDRHYEENLSTLQYATQAACITNQPTVNLDPKDQLIHQLQSDLAAAYAYIMRNSGSSELPAELRNGSSSVASSPSPVKGRNTLQPAAKEPEPSSKMIKAGTLHESVEQLPALMRARSWEKSFSSSSGSTAAGTLSERVVLPMKTDQLARGSRYQPPPRVSSGDAYDTGHAQFQFLHRQNGCSAAQWHTPRFVPNVKRETAPVKGRAESPWHARLHVVRPMTDAASSATFFVAFFCWVRPVR